MAGAIKLMRSVASTVATTSGSGLPVPVVGTFTTAVLNPNNVEAGTVLLAKGFQVQEVTVSAAARVRLYSTLASQAADTGTITSGVPSANRPRTRPPILGSQHGVIMDLYLNTPDKYSWMMSPAAEGFSGDDPQTSTIYYAVDNISGVAQSIVVTVTYIPDQS